MDDQALPEILYEDNELLCINKPAGLLSIRDGYDPLLPYVTSLLSPLFGRLWVVHRLDRDTSGTLLLARTPQAHRSLNISFENRQVHKSYHAIIHGVPKEVESVVDLPLKVDGDHQHRTIVNHASGKPAQTRLHVLRSSGDFSLIEAQPLTGYTHQIRAHLLAIGFPILLDPLYSLNLQNANSNLTSNEFVKLVISRLALHACALEFFHPATGLSMKITAHYPVDFEAALIKLHMQ